jgi:Family of unknown function (DUF5947)
MAAASEQPARSRLAQLARRRAEAAASDSEASPQYERCELCSAPIDPRHRHLLDLRSRELMCACQACSLLFDRGAAGGEHFKLVGDRVTRLEEFELSDPAWESLRIPVDIAFFFFNSEAGRTMAFYPSPMGPTESQLGLEAWTEIEAANPVLATMSDDVEALLVNRARGARRQWLVPIGACYELVGTIRLRWKGLSGGKEVWTEIDDFFDGLDRRARPAAATRAESGTEASAGAASPAGGS